MIVYCILRLINKMIFMQATVLSHGTFLVGVKHKLLVHANHSIEPKNMALPLHLYNNLQLGSGLKT